MHCFIVRSVLIFQCEPELGSTCRTRIVRRRRMVLIAATTECSTSYRMIVLSCMRCCLALPYRIIMYACKYFTMESWCGVGHQWPRHTIEPRANRQKLAMISKGDSVAAHCPRVRAESAASWQ